MEEFRLEYVFLLAIGIIIFLGAKQKIQKNQQLNESVHQLLKMYENMDNILKDNFLKELKKSELTAFLEYSNKVINGTSISFYKSSKNTKVAIQKLHQWIMRTQLEGQIKLLILMEDNKIKEMTEHLDRKQKQQLNEVQTKIKKGEEIHLNEVPKYIQSGLIKELGYITAPVKETLFSINDVFKTMDFNNLTNHNNLFNEMILNNILIQDISHNDQQMSNIINHMDAQMFNEQFMQNTTMESMNFTMEESLKSVLPFDYGGYLLGEGVNPSDTMVAEMNNIMMNDMNNMMNDMNDASRMNNI